MWHLELPWETWRAINDALRAHGLPYMVEHAAELGRRLDERGPAEVTIRLSLPDDVFLRSVNWAGWRLGRCTRSAEWVGIETAALP